MSRYSNRIVATNEEDLYYDVLRKRGVKKIKQYTTPTLKRPTQEMIDSIGYTKYVWTVGDRFWDLADRFYGDRKLWWVIARFNNKPTEGHMSPGDEIKIPKNIVHAREVLS